MLKTILDKRRKTVKEERRRKKCENKPHSSENSAQGQKGGKIIWWLGTPMGPELAEIKATFREVSLTTIMIISMIRSSSFVTTKIDWRRWNCLSWTREITGGHEICFQIPQSSWKTYFIYFVSLLKITSTLKVTRWQTSAHKFSLQFMPCTKAFGKGSGRFAIQPVLLLSMRGDLGLHQPRRKTTFL